MIFARRLGVCRPRIYAVYFVLYFFVLKLPLALGQGLSYEEKEFSPAEPTAVVTPTDTFLRDQMLGSATTWAKVSREVSGTIANIEGDIVSDAAREQLENEDLEFKRANPALPAEDLPLPNEFVEVRDIVEPSAAWLQIKFKLVKLGNTKIVLTSPDSARTQTVTSQHLGEQNVSSLIFPGQRLRIQVQSSDGEKSPRLQELIASVIVGKSLVPTLDEGQDSADPTGIPENSDVPEQAQCGADRRSTALHKFVARVTPRACTAFLLTNGVAATAGHCMKSGRELQKLEFNVPPSDARGQQNFSSEADTYSIALDTITCSDCGGPNLPHGEDWALFRILPNDQTGKTPWEVQGVGFEAVANDQKNGSAVVVLGYGRDINPLVANFGLQGATGKLVSTVRHHANRVAIVHRVDTDQGQSGAPILLEQDGNLTSQVIGIHTGGQCLDDPESGNMGTSFVNEALLGALQRLTLGNAAITPVERN